MLAAAGLLAGIPVVLATLGPPLSALPASGGPPFAPDGFLGTDVLGRDVLGVLLHGGASMLAITFTATALSYLAGGLIGLLAGAARSRWLDELLMRPLDIVLAIPGILILLLAASLAGHGPVIVTAVVVVVNAPAIARLVRAATLDAARRPAAEAMRLQGENWWAIHAGYVGRCLRRPLLADAGARLTSAVYLTGAANFLGAGLAPDSPDWAVAIDRNKAGLLLQPWAVLAPAALVVAFTIGVNLLADELTRGKP